MKFIAHPHACNGDLRQLQHLCNIEFNFDVGQKGHKVLIDGFNVHSPCAHDNTLMPY